MMQAPTSRFIHNNNNNTTTSNTMFAEPLGAITPPTRNNNNNNSGSNSNRVSFDSTDEDVAAAAAAASFLNHNGNEFQPHHQQFNSQDPNYQLQQQQLQSNGNNNNTTNNQQNNKRRKTTSVKVRDGNAPPERLPFVTATFEMVSSKQPDDCVGWGIDGATLEIRKIGPFCEHVLPTYFSHSNLSSFVRQLNMYGFQKVECRSGVTHSFKHESFLRNRPDLLNRLTRKVNVGKKRERHDHSDDDGDSGSAGGTSNNHAMMAQQQHHHHNNNSNNTTGNSGTRSRPNPKVIELETICKRLEEENIALMAELVKAKQQIQRLEAERGQYMINTGRNMDTTRKVQTFFGFNPNEKIGGELEDTTSSPSFRKFDSNTSFSGMMDATTADPFGSGSQLQNRTNSLAGLASVAHGLVSTNTFPSIAGFQSAFSFPSMSMNNNNNNTTNTTSTTAGNNNTNYSSNRIPIFNTNTGTSGNSNNPISPSNNLTNTASGMPMKNVPDSFLTSTPMLKSDIGVVGGS
jgi:hypothetical protein